MDNGSYRASLEVGKVYRSPQPSRATPKGWIRMVDESGEDYLYPEKRFVPVSVPPRGRRALAAK
jgi:hypothetical protein